MPIPEELQELDSIFLKHVAELLPEFAEAEVDARYEDVDEAYCEAFVKLSRPVANGLVDLIIFSRDYDEESDSFLFSLDFAVLRPGQENDFFPPITNLEDVLYRECPNHPYLDCGVGAGWSLLGQTLAEADEAIPIILETYREFAMPVVASRIAEQSGPPAAS